jgi:two-component system, NarL family, response regulator, fimbrial Z protein, FimZ
MGTAANPHAVVLEREHGSLDGVKALLERVGRAVRSSADADEALELIEELNRPLVVVDPEACGRRGLDWITEARRRGEGVHVIVVADSPEPDLVRGAFVAGAEAFIGTKQNLAAFDSTLTLAAGSRAEAEELGLSKRELELRQHVARGESNRQIAERLWVTESTVKFHLARSYKKLGVSSRLEAVWLIRHGSRLPRHRRLPGTG